jgi:tetratricopeptide (TPR) repeat protein
MAGDAVTLRGFKAPHPSGSALRSTRTTVRAEFRPGQFRSGSEVEARETVQADDVLELEFSDGLRLWLTADEYRQQLAGDAQRGGEAPATDGALPVPTVWRTPVRAAERGLGDVVLKSLKVLGIDLAGATAKVIANRLEAGDPASPKRPGPGLYRCRATTGAFALAPATGADVPVSPDRPVLVLLHGTMSSTWGSFGDLWTPGRRETLAQLRAHYGDDVFAFEHRTLTRSVIANALELANTLPEGARIDLLSHSRGGLVGELLCRANVTDDQPCFDPADVDLAGRLRDAADGTSDDAAADVAEALAQARQDLEALGATLARKKIRIGTFVRVACPALGTSLLSHRLDRWLGVIGSVGWLAPPGTPIADVAAWAGDFIIAVLKEKANPRTFPGLAFFLPEAGLIRVLNNGQRAVDGRLAVVAGDIQPQGIWKRLLTLALDAFYDGEHDLVVNTGSMYGGMPRTGDNALLSYHSGPACNHFSYFANTESAEAVARALVTPAGEAVAGFERLRPAPRTIASRGPTGPAPSVFVLPGIMGSELASASDRVWVNVFGLALGGLTKLAIDRPDVRPLWPYPSYYGDLIDFLGIRHKVIPFAYDWRLEPEQEADRLALEVRTRIDEARRDKMPVRILAHSMGGLVVRAMIARHEDLWRELKALPGSRFVMLGTPNGGSHSITELIVGQSSTFRKLAILDFRHSAKQLLEVIVRFPGILAMLPASGNWFDPAVWERLRQQAGGGWVRPAPEALERARAFRELIDRSPIDPEAMVYVAGVARETADDLVFDPGSRSLRLIGTRDGDGRVTWKSGIPKELKPWYMPVEHGDLSASKTYFDAILDLLEHGTTSRLSQQPPVERGAIEGPFVITRAPEQSLPDEEALAADVLGGTVRRRQPMAPGGVLPVRLVHGDLAYASYPLLVGHYVGDPIVSAEAALDRMLGGLLKERHGVGAMYPGPVETSLVLINPSHAGADRWNGAVVVGLGSAGGLTVGSLTSTIARGATAYALRRRERAAEAGWAAKPGERLEVGLSALLIGTNAGGVRVADSVLAIVEGCRRANQSLEAAESPVRIAKLELIELYEHQVLQAYDALRFLGDDTRRRLLTFDGVIVKSRGARRAVRLQDAGRWWQRVQVSGAPLSGAGDGGLRFLSLTGRARAEARVVGTQRALVDQFVARAIRNTNADPSLGTTLFELLLPAELKEQAPDRENLVIVVDEEAARYPWELMQDNWDEEGKPLVVESGVLRQLELAQGEYRETIRGSVGNTALVVGDPILPENGPFAPLEGARKEAAAVAAVLQRGGFEADPLIQPSAGEVIQALFQKEYRVLHLAGHGVYQWTPRASSGDDGATPAAKVTGMVLGEGVFLTPAEVRQMRRVPDLVFVNCCHLGRVEPRPGGEQRDFNYFAANVATEFICMGVRAVVAAGWAVNDAAAQTFAQTFYARMLDGLTLGEAVTAARRETWEQHRYANTWGAFQCYGDPDFRLGPAAQAVVPEGGKLRPFASVDETVAELENVASDIDIAGIRPLEGALERLAAIETLCGERGWERAEGVPVHLARAYGAAGRLEKAIEWYASALACEDRSLTVRDLEQLSNYESRSAVTRRRTDGSKHLEALQQQVEAAIRRLEWLMDEPGACTGNGAAPPETAIPGIRAAATPERLALLGSAYKRLAWLSSGTARRKALEASRTAYEQGDALARAGGRFDPYVLANWVVASVAAGWYGRRCSASARKAMRERLDEAAAELEARLRVRSDFWESVCAVDIKVTRILLDGRLGAHAATAPILSDYRAARALGNPREFESTRDQFEFLVAMAEGVDAEPPGMGQLGGWIRELRTGLAADGTRDGA